MYTFIIHLVIKMFSTRTYLSFRRTSSLQLISYGQEVTIRKLPTGLSKFYHRGSFWLEVMLTWKELWIKCSCNLEETVEQNNIILQYTMVDLEEAVDRK